MELTRIIEQPTPYPIIMLPLIYDMGAHVLQLAERRDVNTPIIIMQAVNLQLRKFHDKRVGMNTGEPTLYAAILDLLSNLTFPMQGQPPQMPGGNVPGGQFMMGQMGGGGPMEGHMQNQVPPAPNPMMNQMGMNMGGGPTEWINYF